MNKSPRKEVHEGYEAEYVTIHLERYGFGEIEILDTCDRPDLIVRSQEFGLTMGVDFTRVYSSDRFSPDHHYGPEPAFIPDDPVAINELKERLLDRIRRKVKSAQSDFQVFDTSILAIFMNECETECFQYADWDEWLHGSREKFLPIDPYTHILMWDERGSAMFGEIEDMPT